MNKSHLQSKNILSTPVVGWTFPCSPHYRSPISSAIIKQNCKTLIVLLNKKYGSMIESYDNIYRCENHNPKTIPLNKVLNMIFQISVIASLYSLLIFRRLYNGVTT